MDDVRFSIPGYALDVTSGFIVKYEYDKISEEFHRVS